MHAFHTEIFHCEKKFERPGSLCLHASRVIIVQITLYCTGVHRRHVALLTIHICAGNGYKLVACLRGTHKRTQYPFNLLVSEFVGVSGDTVPVGSAGGGRGPFSMPL